MGCAWPGHEKFYADFACSEIHYASGASSPGQKPVTRANTRREP